jgi:hypothetical protein
MWNAACSSTAPVLLNEPNATVSIELKHLRYAEVAERCDSFRKAADLLALKQSNLSRRVRHLEEQLAVALFERTNGGVRPTSAGRDFVNGVRRILDESQADAVFTRRRDAEVALGRLLCGNKRSWHRGRPKAEMCHKLPSSDEKLGIAWAGLRRMSSHRRSFR